MPGLFAPVRLGGALYLDGGAVDRTFLALHKAWRPERRAVCPLVKNDGVELVPRDGIIDVVYVVKTPRANAKLWGLCDFEGERKAAEELSKRSLAALANRAVDYGAGVAAMGHVRHFVAAGHAVLVVRPNFPADSPLRRARPPVRAASALPPRWGSPRRRRPSYWTAASTTTSSFANRLCIYILV